MLYLPHQFFIRVAACKRRIRAIRGEYLCVAPAEWMKDHSISRAFAICVYLCDLWLDF